jgi:hypothetical protein
MSNERSIDIKIGDNVFTILRINALEAWPLFGDLQKEFLPSISELIMTVAKPAEESADAEEREGRVMAEAIAKVSTSLSGDQLKKWTDRLLTADYISVSINGAPPIKLDGTAKALAFKDFSEVPELLFHVLKFNFAGPLAGFLSRFGLDPSKIKTAINK